MAGAAMTAGSNPTAVHKKGIELANVAAIVDNNGRVQKTTVDTCIEIPPT